ncbi:DEAD/DEAH box helicase [Ferrimonas kyonanensis]|uniref:DEAD/DEAH box helicase n=1 Tax=Ferrimonas kyonanensis TaxID=364763 RepID=UPI0004832925|nr:DEAD/DEAH box helicase [Ferrimonas kyonanensis]
MNFPLLGINEPFSHALQTLGYKGPTKVQAAVIPLIFDSEDLRVQSKTGSGKTAAYALPILQRLSGRPTSSFRTTTALILVPTRELASQVSVTMKQFARALPGELKVTAVYGGVKINPQMMALRGGADVVIATPGRLLDLVSCNALKLGKVETLVLDEADKMVNADFKAELDAIVALLPRQRQTVMMSATFPPEVDALCDALLNNAKTVEVYDTPIEQHEVEVRAIEVDRNRRNALLQSLIDQHKWHQVMVFVASKRTANNLASKLHKAGFDVDTLHGDMTQGARNRALADFRSGELQVLVATDLAARGIDIIDLPCVVNFDLPRSVSDYTHRIGRTGRQGSTGVAISFIGIDDEHGFSVIEKKKGYTVKREQIAGFERVITTPTDSALGKAPVKGKRMSKKDKARALAAQQSRGDKH